MADAKATPANGFDSIPPSIRRRFHQKHSRGGVGCWEWLGTCDTQGFGKLSFRGRSYGAHRIAYALSVGDIPAGMYVCHHCDNVRCVRPDHFFLGTPNDNVQDMLRKGRQCLIGRKKENRTHCPSGHAYAGDNLRINRRTGYHHCRECDRAANRRLYKQKKGGAP